MNSPCKDCPDRQMGCHSNCEKYLSYDKYRQEIRAKRLQAKKLEDDLYLSSRSNRRR